MQNSKKGYSSVGGSGLSGWPGQGGKAVNTTAFIKYDSSRIYCGFSILGAPTKMTGQKKENNFLGYANKQALKHNNSV